MSAAQIRIILALTALVGAVGIATAVVFYLGDRERLPAPRAGTAPGSSAVAAAPSPSTAPTTPPALAAETPSRTTPSPGAGSPTAVRGLTVRATTAINVRSGPGTTFAIIGSLQAGEVARVTGRDGDAAWVMVELAAGPGWVAAGLVEATGDLALAPVVDPSVTRTPTPATSATPTATPTPVRSPSPSATATARPASPSITATAPRLSGGLPDIVLQEVTATQGGRIMVSIANAGVAPISGRRVSVVALDEAANVIFSESTAPLTLGPGSAVTVELGYQLATTMTLTIILNAENAIDESSTGNNRRRVTLTPR